MVGLPQQIRILLVDLTEDAHPQTRTGERVAVDHVRRQTQLDTDLAHLVLEQFTQGLDQLQLHVFRQPAYVVMGFDHMGLARLGAGRLDHVGVDGALGQEGDRIQLARLLLEDVDKQVADDLAFLFRIGRPFEGLEKTLLRIDADHLDTHMLREGSHHLIALVQAQQTIIDEDAGQLIADRPVQQGGYHRRVDTAGKTQHHLGVTHLLADLADALLDDLARSPERLAATDLKQKTLDDALTLTGMGHLGVELQTVEVAFFIRHAGHGCVLGFTNHLESRRQGVDPVAMTHPDIQQTITLGAGVVLDIPQQVGVAACAHLGIAVLVFIGGGYRSAKLRGHGLHAVADAKHRNPQLEHFRRRHRRFSGGDRLRTTGEDDTGRAITLEPLVRVVIGKDFAIDARFTYPTRNQLGVLGAKVENQDSVGMDISGHAGWVPRQKNRRGMRCRSQCPC